MTSKTLGRLMLISIVFLALCGLFLCAYLVPHWVKGIIYSYPEFNHWFWPWLILAWLVALPCFFLLSLVWKWAGAVIQDTVLTLTTANWVKTGSRLLFIDAGILFLGNIVLLLLNMNHPGVFIILLVGDILLISFALIAEALSRYLTKASVISIPLGINQTLLGHYKPDKSFNN